MTADSSEETIRNRAYQLWEDDGRPDGKHETHWNQAARELGLADPLEQPPGSTIDPAKKGEAGDVVSISGLS
jgi:hypothetical protein